MLFVDVEEAREGFVDEHDWNEGRKSFLRESSKILGNDTPFESDVNDGDDEDPKADPSPSRQKLDFMSIQELEEKNESMIEKKWKWEKKIWVVHYFLSFNTW